MKIYTRLGDTGRTRLFDGTPVSKDDPRVEAYGTVDELNSVLGLARAFVNDLEVEQLLRALQGQLLTLGAQLANTGRTRKQTGKGQLEGEWIVEMESWIDQYAGEVPPLGSFVLSGGGPAGALLHLGRTVCRRAERETVRLAEDLTPDPMVVQYLNRLSDLLFMMARVVNYREGREEIKW